ncbi:glomulin-like [Cloeon dipterum]|uniref:glomulin-like n=1 Tax=Cloeon dipterum TaxID=197152 RepID=UPI003220507A
MDMPNDSNSTMNKLKELLLSSQFEEARDLLKDPSFIESAINYPEDLFGILTGFISPQNQGLNPALVETCQEMMKTFVEDLSDPDVTHLVLLGYLTSTENDVLFVVVLQCVDSCLQKMKKARALRESLTSIQVALSDLSLCEREQIERLFIEISKFCWRIIDNIDEEDFKEAEKQKQCLATFLLSWLLNDDIPRSTLDESIKALAKVLPHLGHPFAYLNEAGRWRKKKGATLHFLDQVESHCCYGVLYYNILHHGICYESFPQVYSQQYLFVRLGALCSTLLSSQRELQKKGISLLKDVVDRVDPGSIPHTVLSSEHYTCLFLGLSHVMLECEDEKLRADTPVIFRKFIMAFNDKGQHLILLHGYQTMKDQSVRGYMVTVTKDLVVTYNQSSDYFMRRLPDLLYLMLTLPKEVRSNLHMNVSTVLCKLNFLRYLITVDQNPENFAEFRSIAEQFLKHIPDALKRSRESVNEILIDADELSKQESSRTSVEVGGSVLPTPSFEEQVKAATLWRTQLDTIEHVYNLLMEKF